ncbi:MAG: UTRA domain-containing protein [Rhizobiaceae bacterium]|nr:UTRA domain-containing protein [Rhizobiaceae bacterium]
MRRRILALLPESLGRSDGRLPAERQLTDAFGTTRITLREALTQLEAEGAIYREERRGWFVSPQRLLYNPETRGHFEEMVRGQGREPRTELIEADLVAASPEMAERLELHPGTVIPRVRRARSVDGRCVLYVEHYLRPDLSVMLGKDLTGSMTETYRRDLGFTIERVTFDIMPTALGSEAAQALRVTRGSPALLITRINRDQHDRVIDCDVEYWRHHAVLLRVEASSVGGFPRG